MSPKAAVTLGVLVAAGPTAWGLHLTVSYWLVPVACRHGTGALYLTTVLATLAAAGAIAVTWRRLARANGAPDYEQGNNLLNSLALALAVFFLLIVLVTGLAPLVVGPCE